MLGCACWGAVPLVVGAGVAEILVVMAILVAFGGGVGAGSSVPLGVHPTCRSLCWGGGRRSPRAAFSRSAGMGRCWITLQRAATGVPRPSLGSPLPPAPVSRAPAALRWHPFSGRRPRALLCRGAAGTGSRVGCRLTVRSGADRGRSCLVCVGSQRLRLERQTWLGGRWAPGTSSLSSSPPVLGTDELFFFFFK